MDELTTHAPPRDAAQQVEPARSVPTGIKASLAPSLAGPPAGFMF
jgi:hypothetical protein